MLSALENSLKRTRDKPCTIICAVPSAARILRITAAAQPIGFNCSGVGCSVSGSCCNVIAIKRSPLSAASKARNEASRLAKERQLTYIHPFDDPAVWEGASRMVDEIKTQMPDEEVPDAIVCSVGGGGLFSGIIQGLDRAGWGDQVQVLPVETQGADSLAQALEKKTLITLPAITSIAASLGAIRVAENAFKEAQRPNVQSVVLDDAEACAACWRFLDDERFLVEPACGVSIALAYDGRLKRYLKGFRPESKVVIIVCGGSKISLEMLNKYQQTYGKRSEELSLIYGH